MKVVYLASPYRADSEWAVFFNIEGARHIARELWQRGVAVMSPCTNSAFMGGDDIPDEVFLKGDLELLARCDAIVLNDGWGGSEGCQAEREFAKGCHMQIFHTADLYGRANIFDAWLNRGD